MTTLILISAFIAFVIVIVFFCAPAPRTAAIIGLSLLRLPLRIATVALAVMMLAMPAAAQDQLGSGLITVFLPQLLELLAVFLSAALIWAAAWAKRKFGIDIEAKHRDALHSALMTGARLAASRQLTGAAAIALALEYARQSVPEALAKLAPPAEVLKDLAEAKVQEAVHDKRTDLLAGAGLPILQPR